MAGGGQRTGGTRCLQQVWPGDHTHTRTHAHTHTCTALLSLVYSCAYSVHVCLYRQRSLLLRVLVCFLFSFPIGLRLHLPRVCSLFVSVCLCVCVVCCASQTETLSHLTDLESQAKKSFDQGTDADLLMFCVPLPHLLMSLSLTHVSSASRSATSIILCRTLYLSVPAARTLAMRQPELARSFLEAIPKAHTPSNTGEVSLS